MKFNTSWKQRPQTEKLLLNKNSYSEQRRKYLFLIILGFALSVLLLVLNISKGNYHTSIKDSVYSILFKDYNNRIRAIIVYSRIPRLLAAILVGSSLTVAGFSYQLIFDNRMASPDILGVSQGSGVGASFAILFRLPFAYIGFFSFLGGILSVFITIFFSGMWKNEKRSNISMILSGIIVSGFMNSLLGLMKYLSNDVQLSSITYWLLGGLYNVTYKQLAIVFIPIILCISIIFAYRWKLVIIQHGKKDSISHGINYNSTRNIVIVSSTLLTALSVSISGTIGWVGLAIPNIIRVLIQDDDKYVIPLAILYGSVFMMYSDFLARTLTKSEIPIGIITGFLGAIIFIITLILRKRR